MEFIESTLTSKYQITIPKQVRERLGIKEKDHVIFLMEDKNIRLIRKPEDIITAMDNFSEGRKFSAKKIQAELRKDRNNWK